MRKLLFYTALFLLSAVIYAVPVLAQKTAAPGRVSGTVTDAANAVIAEAVVSLIDANGATIATVRTGMDGTFSFVTVRAATYVLSILKPGFTSLRRTITVTSGAQTTADVQLEVSALQTEVTVSAEAGHAADVRTIDQQVNVINDEEILARAPEVVAQVVDEEPGVNLQRTSPSLSAVFVRGLTGRNVAVYVDGVRYTTSAQRGGVGTFFSLIEPSSLDTVEVLRGPNSSQYGSDVLGGVVNFISRTPVYGNNNDAELHGHTNLFYSSPTNGFGSNLLLTYGQRNYGVLLNVNGRRINRLRPGGGIDSHAAVTRFLGIPSDIFGERLPDTAFTQYGGLIRTNFNLNPLTQLNFSYARNQQDGGRRYDQLLGGDGNLIADLRNLMTDLLYARVSRQKLAFFDNASFTVSYNGQREERVNQGGQGNPLAAITSQRERTNVFGFNFHIDKQLNERNSLLFGADVYRDKITAPAYTFEPSTGLTAPSRPRIPNGASYLSYGMFVQNVFTAIPDRLRVSGSLRYSVASYKSEARSAPLGSDGRQLFPDDSARFDAISGRIGAVLNLGKGFDIAAKYARGFRAPNTTDLGIIGLVGTGFEVDAKSAALLGGFIGNASDSTAISTGIPVKPLGPEGSDSFDISFRYTHPRFKAELTGFTNKLKNVYFDQALVLPPGAVGKFLGSERIVSQNANGLVFVGVATAPVLVRVNYDNARLTGVEFSTEARLSKDFTLDGNFTAIRAKSLLNGLPPNIEGGLPPPTGFISLRYQPAGSSRLYLEAYSVLAARQRRLSSLDLSDRRTGAPRTRAQIANFFNRGARIHGLIGNGADGRPNTSDDILFPTGETLARVQNRVLGTANSSILYPELPGYGLVGLRGAFRFAKNSEFLIDFENLADKSYRGISWGIDGAGRGVTVHYRYKF